jgi:tyrosyl-tRNA synthetase
MMDTPSLDSMTVEEQVSYVTKGCVDVVREVELRKKLQGAITERKPLVVKVGFDPTAPDLHLGHVVLIRKMKHFQDLGHKVVFLIGDFTGLIGDPTGRSKTRPPLSRDDIKANAETYKSQIFKLLRQDCTIIDFNSRWLGKLGSEDWIRLAARYNVAQMLERRDFKRRFQSGKAIAIHEFLYPLAQAYDSVYLGADIELGGTDQLFNLNVGRDIMPSFDLKPQVVLTVPLLVGLDGVEKMSKSAGNYIGVDEVPVEMFGKLMSISDTLMWEYYELLTDLSNKELQTKRDAVEAGTLHPKRAKMDLAKLVVGDFHSKDAAIVAELEFERVFSRREAPRDIQVVQWQLPDEPRSWSKLLVDIGFATSNSEAVRKIRQGGVRLNDEKIGSPLEPLQEHLARGNRYTIRVGRKSIDLDVV